MVFRKRGIAQYVACDSGFFTILIAPALVRFQTSGVVFFLCDDGVLDGEGYADRDCFAAGIGDAIAQDRNGKAGLIGFVRNEGRERIELNVDRKRAIFKKDVREWDIRR